MIGGRIALSGNRVIKISNLARREFFPEVNLGLILIQSESVWIGDSIIGRWLPRNLAFLFVSVQRPSFRRRFVGSILAWQHFLKSRHATRRSRVCHHKGTSCSRNWLQSKLPTHCAALCVAKTFSQNIDWKKLSHDFDSCCTKLSAMFWQEIHKILFRMREFKSVTRLRAFWLLI